MTTGGRSLITNSIAGIFVELILVADQLFRGDKEMPPGGAYPG